MEVEDALSAKFRTLIEGLMVETTSEIVRMFSKLLSETRVEISRSWKEIDLLKQQLEECELQKTEAIFRAQMLCELKSEDDEVEVSHMVSQPVAQNENAVRPQPGGSKERAAITPVEDRDVSLENAEDKDVSLESAEDRDVSLENAEDRDVSLENAEDRDVSLENAEDRDVSLENAEDRDVSLENAEDRDACVENTEASDRPETDQSSNTGASSSDIKSGCAAENSPPHNQETHGTQTVVEPILLCLANESPIKGENTSPDTTVPQPTANTVSNGPSSSVDMLAVNPISKEIKPIVKKRKLIKKKKHANDMGNAARALRDRQHLSMHRRCMCCMSDECYIQSTPSRAHHQVPTVYICRKCEKRFKTHMLFKSHKCSMPQSCDRCGQMFATMQGLSSHSQEVSSMSRPQFSCSQCDQTFATQCAWNLHKKIHGNSTSAQDTKENTVDTLNTNAVDVHKDIRAKLEVRLERISDSQLEAALCTKKLTGCESSKHTEKHRETEKSLKHTENPAAAEPDEKSADVFETSKAQESHYTLLDSGTGHADVRKVYAVMSPSTCQIEIGEDLVALQSPTAHGSDNVKKREKRHSESDESGLSSSPRKRKISDCSHDAFNGVFPVERILRWRDNKGKSEVRVKWMPCSLCGVKFQNTWEPAESFPDLETNK